MSKKEGPKNREIVRDRGRKKAGTRESERCSCQGVNRVIARYANMARDPAKADHLTAYG